MREQHCWKDREGSGIKVNKSYISKTNFFFLLWIWLRLNRVNSDEIWGRPKLIVLVMGSKRQKTALIYASGRGADRKLDKLFQNQMQVNKHSTRKETLLRHLTSMYKSIVKKLHLWWCAKLDTQTNTHYVELVVRCFVFLSKSPNGQ